MTRCLLLAAGTVAAMSVNSQPIPKDFEIPEPTVQSGESSVVITDDDFGGPRNVRYRSAPQPRNGTTTLHARPRASHPTGPVAQATGPVSQGQPDDKTSQEVTSIIERANRIASTTLPFSFAKGMFSENSFGGFVLGIGTAVLVWVMTRALVFFCRLVFRGSSTYISPSQRCRSVEPLTIDAQPPVGYSSAQAKWDADVRCGIKRPSSHVAVSQDDTPAYLAAIRELESERPEEGTLAKAYALADGDPGRTRATYIRLRAEQLGSSTGTT
jgi:hypothetical protein